MGLLLYRSWLRHSGKQGEAYGAHATRGGVDTFRAQPYSIETFSPGEFIARVNLEGLLTERVLGHIPRAKERRVAGEQTLSVFRVSATHVHRCEF
jgi:hypothetical protein